MRALSPISLVLLLVASATPTLAGCVSEVRCEGANCAAKGEGGDDGVDDVVDSSSSGDVGGGSNAGGGHGQGAAPGQGGGSAGGSPGGTNALAIFESQIPPYDPSGSTGNATAVTSSGSGAPVGDDLWLILSSHTDLTCADPHDDYGCYAHWRLTLQVPPAMQTVGVHPIGDNGVYMSFSETSDPQSSDPDDCSGGGGAGFNGELEILSITETEVVFGTNLENVFFEANVDLSGPFKAPRCH